MDIRDVILEAQAEAQEIMREMAQELASPIIGAQIKAVWAGLPDEMKDKFKVEKPQAYAALMRELQRSKEDVK